MAVYQNPRSFHNRKWFTKSPLGINLLTSEMQISKENSGVTWNRWLRPARRFPLPGWRRGPCGWISGRSWRLRMEGGEWAGCGVRGVWGGGRKGRALGCISPQGPPLCPWVGLSASPCFPSPPANWGAYCFAAGFSRYGEAELSRPHWPYRFAFTRSSYRAAVCRLDFFSWRGFLRQVMNKKVIMCCVPPAVL